MKSNAIKMGLTEPLTGRHRNPYRAGRISHPSMRTHPRYATRDLDTPRTRPSSR